MTRILHAFGIAPMSLVVDLVSSVSSVPDLCVPRSRRRSFIASSFSALVEIVVRRAVCQPARLHRQDCAVTSRLRRGIR